MNTEWINETPNKDINPILVVSFKGSELGGIGTPAGKEKGERGRQLVQKNMKYSCCSLTTPTPNLFINSSTWQIFLEHLLCARHCSYSKIKTPSLSLKKKGQHINNSDKVINSYDSQSTSWMPGRMLIPLHVLSYSRLHSRSKCNHLYRWNQGLLRQGTYQGPYSHTVAEPGLELGAVWGQSPSVTVNLPWKGLS